MSKEKSIDQKINEMLWEHQFSNIRHIEYDKEFKLYRAIASGDLPLVERGIKEFLYIFHNEDSTIKSETLSKDPLLNVKYHVVVFVSLATRYCVRYGLSRELAYNMSDVFIQELDNCYSIAEVEAIFKNAAVTYTKYMQKNRSSNIYSMQISRCLEYIHNHLQQDLSLETIAQYFELSPSYLSRLFKQEMKTSISAYIKKQRLIHACNMLELTKYSISEISEMLQFSSQSHFTSSFRAEYGVTPKKYRDLRAKPDWRSNDTLSASDS